MVFFRLASRNFCGIAVSLSKVFTGLSILNARAGGAFQQRSVSRPAGFCNGAQKSLGNLFLRFGVPDFFALCVFHIKTVDGRASFSADFGKREVEFKLCQGGGDKIKQADAVFGVDIDDGSAFGGLIVKLDAGGNRFVFERLIERGRLGRLSDKAFEMDLVHEDFGRVGVKGIPTLRANKRAGDSVDNGKGVQDDSIASREDFGAEDVDAAGGQSAGKLGEDARIIPSGDAQNGVAAISRLAPGDDRVQRMFAKSGLPAHEAVDAANVGQDFSGPVGVEIAVGQGFKVSVHLIGANVGGNLGLDLAAEVKAELVLSNALGGVPGQNLVSLMVQASKKSILEAVPHLPASGHRVAECQQRQKVEVFAFLGEFREGLNHLRVFNVSPLRDERHRQMLFDQEAQRLDVFGGQSEPLGGPLGDSRAGARMAARAPAGRLAGVVQDERQIKQIGTVQTFQ